MFEAEKGVNFYEAIKQCKAKIQEKKHSYLVMVFNDIHITVSPDSNSDDLATIYDLKHKLIQHNLTY